MKYRQRLLQSGQNFISQEQLRFVVFASWVLYMGIHQEWDPKASIPAFDQKLKQQF